MLPSLSADPDFRREVLATAERAVRLAERDALVLLIWRFDMLVDGIAQRAAEPIRAAQFAGGRQVPLSTHPTLEREERRYALAAYALWHLAEAATRPLDERARLALAAARHALAAWEALATHPDDARP